MLLPYLLLYLDRTLICPVHTLREGRRRRWHRQRRSRWSWPLRGYRSCHPQGDRAVSPRKTSSGTLKIKGENIEKIIWNVTWINIFFLPSIFPPSSCWFPVRNFFLQCSMLLGQDLISRGLARMSTVACFKMFSTSSKRKRKCMFIKYHSRLVMLIECTSTIEKLCFCSNLRLHTLWSFLLSSLNFVRKQSMILPPMKSFPPFWSLPPSSKMTPRQCFWRSVWHAFCSRGLSR